MNRFPNRNRSQLPHVRLGNLNPHSRLVVLVASDALCSNWHPMYATLPLLELRSWRYPDVFSFVPWEIAGLVAALWLGPDGIHMRNLRSALTRSRAEFKVCDPRSYHRYNSSALLASYFRSIPLVPGGCSQWHFLYSALKRPLCQDTKALVLRQQVFDFEAVAL